jgi:hypothetical protein
MVPLQGATCASTRIACKPYRTVKVPLANSAFLFHKNDKMQHLFENIDCKLPN